MEQLWAPWRMDYILQPEEDICFICRAVDNLNQDPDNLVVYRGRYSLAMLNRYPYNNGHLLVAPHQHGMPYDALSDEIVLDIYHTSQMMMKIFKSVMNPDGFNLGYNLGKVAGAGLLDHLHLHIVPRWNGDTNFMPVLDQTRVISEALVSTYRKIKLAMS